MLVLTCWSLLLLALAAAGLPTEEEVDAVVERADVRVRSKYSGLASERYSGNQRPRWKKTTRESRLMGERNILVAEAAAVLERTHGVNDSAAAHRMAQEGLIRKLRRGADRAGVSEVAMVEEMCSPSYEPNCDPDYAYRTISGQCNNLGTDKKTWGAMSTALRRMAPPAYADGVKIPRGGWVAATSDCRMPLPNRLPNPRRVSLVFHPHTSNEDDKATLMQMQFGQFLDHDITLTPESEAENCCTNQGLSGVFAAECFPINFPCNDPTFSNLPFSTKPDVCTKMMELTRSTAFCEGTTPAREQMNGITAFIDASNVYGSDDKTARSLRTFSNGMLKMLNLNGNIGSILPKVNGTYVAGDVRATENPGLSSLHTIFLREHNRIAGALGALDATLSDEELYQRTRRIVGAEMQNIVYGQYLPEVVGEAMIDSYNLRIDKPSDYSPDIDPSIANAFATAAFRYGHSMIRSMVGLVEVGRRRGSRVTSTWWSSYRLKDNFFDSSVYQSKMEGVLRGMVFSKAESPDVNVVTDVTDSLFANTNFPGSDLVARNIQRGRDHGLPGYNKYREICGMAAATSWRSAPAEISQALWSKLSTLYATPNDIDLYPAGLAETKLPGAHTGPTFSCIIGRQYRALKDGDRFFFTSDTGNPFTAWQLANIKARNLGDIICDNTAGIPKMRLNVFDPDSPTFSCGSGAKLDLSLFSDATPSTWSSWSGSGGGGGSSSGNATAMLSTRATTTTTTTTATTTTTTRRRTKTLREHCLRRRGQFAYDADCHKFVNCWDGSAYLQSCHPATLVFDPATGWCNWPTAPGMRERCQ